MNKKIILGIFAFLILIQAVTATEIHISYPRFDLYVDDVYYTTYQTNLDTFFDNMHDRVVFLENKTGWSSEQAHGKKLEIRIRNSTTGCYGGIFSYSGDPYVQVSLSDPFPNIWCKGSYRENETYKMGYPGPLGDYWPYMGGAIHEITHAINPKPILYRRWLTEGWAKYNEYNILAKYGDLNQESADFFILTGTSYYNWIEYIANDYHDTSPVNLEIQKSAGYAITAHMFTMLRENYGFDMDIYYGILMENEEILDYTYTNWGPANYTNYQTDMFIIDLFGKQLGIDMKPIFRYDGPTGPGWGVRQWMDRSWYPDLTGSLGFSDPTPTEGDTIDLIATINNGGDSPLNNISVKFYEGALLIDEKFVDIGAGSVQTTTQITKPIGNYTFTIKINEDQKKFESNYANNEDNANIEFLYNDLPATATATSDVNTGEYSLTITFDGTGTGNAPLSYTWDFDGDGTTDSTNEDDSFIYTNAGNYNANFTVTDNEGDTDSYTVPITVTIPVRPDLIVEEFEMTRTNLTTGERLPLYFKITNNGTGIATNIIWNLDSDSPDQNLDNTKPYNLLPGESKETYAFLQYNAAGNYNPKVTADSTNTIEELDETNNEKTINITI